MATSPKFVPSSLAADPQQFGKYGPIEWLPIRPVTAEEIERVKVSISRYTSDPERMARELKWKLEALAAHKLDQLGAAQKQHEMALVIRRTILAKFSTRTRYAAKYRIGDDRLGQILRGDVLMRFEDVASAERNLGITLP